MAKIVKDWTKYLVAEKSIQEDENYKSITTDYVSLSSWDDIKYYPPRELRKSATDFAVLNYIWQSHSHQCETEKGMEIGCILLMQKEVWIVILVIHTHGGYVLL